MKNNLTKSSANSTTSKHWTIFRSESEAATKLVAYVKRVRLRRLNSVLSGGPLVVGIACDGLRLRQKLPKEAVIVLILRRVR